MGNSIDRRIAAVIIHDQRVALVYWHQLNPADLDQLPPEIIEEAFYVLDNGKITRSQFGATTERTYEEGRLKGIAQVTRALLKVLEPVAVINGEKRDRLDDLLARVASLMRTEKTVGTAVHNAGTAAADMREAAIVAALAHLLDMPNATPLQVLLERVGVLTDGAAKLCQRQRELCLGAFEAAQKMGLDAVEGRIDLRTAILTAPAPLWTPMGDASVRPEHAAEPCTPACSDFYSATCSSCGKAPKPPPTLGEVAAAVKTDWANAGKEGSRVMKRGHELGRARVKIIEVEGENLTPEEIGEALKAAGIGQ